MKGAGRMSAAELREAMAQGKGKKNKYNAQKTEVDGIKFDSAHEAKRYGQLKILERAGHISDLRLQEVIYLHGKNEPLKTSKGRAMRLTLDFTYIDSKTGLRVYEDAKGMPTRDYEVRKAVAAAQGVEVIEV